MSFGRPRHVAKFAWLALAVLLVLAVQPLLHADHADHADDCPVCHLAQHATAIPSPVVTLAPTAARGPLVVPAEQARPTRSKLLLPPGRAPPPQV